MIHALAAAAMVAATGPASRAWTEPVRIVRARPGGPCYVRVRSVVTASGVRGRAVTLLDLATGRSAERVEAGVLSRSDGFDGVRAWSADATGLPVIEGNAQSRLDLLAWAHFFGRSGPERPRVRTLRAVRGTIAVRVTYASLASPIDVTLDARTHRVVRVDDASDGELSRASFGDYRSAAGVVLPFAQRTTSRYGVVRERVVAVDAPRGVPATAFDPPPAPHDTELRGVTSVPMRFERESVILPVRIDGGPVLHLMLDSGAGNSLSPAAARVLRLRLTGSGKAGGVGAGLVPERYARVKRLRVGSAVLRDQPFSVLAGSDPGVDGVLGCELFERLAVRIDVENRLVRLATDAAQLGALGTPVALHAHGCNPEIDGEVDGVRGPMLLDTGSAVHLDVLTPAVLRHELLARYRAHVFVSGGGIGGDTYGYLVRANRVRLGPKTVRNVPVILDVMRSGAFTDPSNLGNVGLPLLRPFTPTFDYRTGRLWLLDPA